MQKTAWVQFSHSLYVVSAGTPTSACVGLASCKSFWWAFPGHSQTLRRRFTIGLLENGYDSPNRATTSGLSKQYTASRGVINFP